MEVYPSGRILTMGYDTVNRFYYGYEDGTTCPASEKYACWYRTFGYDAVGNRWLAANGGLPVQTATPTSNIYNADNRMTTASYDQAGNQLGIGVTGLTYDAENRQASAVDPPQYGGTTSYYRYDGFGRRVEKAVNSGLTVYVYDAFGRMAAEYTNFPNPPAACTTCYLTHDHLGSMRMVTDQLGDLISRHDYLPFGEEIQAGVAGRDNHFGRQDFVKQMFTGQERDAETGLDFFQARYMSAPQGRFLSADPMDPQSWNGYSYVRNSPLNATDPTGMFLSGLPPKDDGGDDGGDDNGGDDPCLYYNCSGGPIGPTGPTHPSEPVTPPPPNTHVAVGPSSNYNNCVAGYGAAGAAVGAGVSLAGTAGAGSLIGPEGTAAGLLVNQLGVAALGTYAGQKAGQLLGSIVCNAGSGSGAPSMGTGHASTGKRVTFGHGARHLAGSGLQQPQVEGAIKAQVQEIAKRSSSTGSFWGKVVVNGQQIYYRAFTLADGTINIGTYTVGAP